MRCKGSRVRLCHKETEVKSGVPSPLNSNHANCGRKDKLAELERQHPAYLHHLYRRATEILADRASMKEIRLEAVSPHPLEDPSGIKVNRPKERSRRYPVKVMYMAVVAPPNEEEGFDGKVFMTRISVPKEWKKTTYHSRFTDCAVGNAVLSAKTDGWRKHFQGETRTMTEMATFLAEKFDLEPFEAGRLVFRYDHFTPGGKKDVKTLRGSQTFPGKKSVPLPAPGFDRCSSPTSTSRLR